MQSTKDTNFIEKEFDDFIKNAKKNKDDGYIFNIFYFFYLRLKKEFENECKFIEKDDETYKIELEEKYFELDTEKDLENVIHNFYGFPETILLNPF